MWPVSCAGIQSLLQNVTFQGLKEVTMQKCLLCISEGHIPLHAALQHFDWERGQFV